MKPAKRKPAGFCISAGLAEWSGGGLPRRLRGFDSRSPLQTYISPAGIPDGAFLFAA